MKLAPNHDGDALWGVGSDLPAPWRRSGLLTPDEKGDTSWKVVVVPDLADLSLTVARACVQLVDAEQAHLERHGQSACWRPRLFWLARCSQRRVGQVSPHLLDRFLLRHTLPQIEAPDRVPELRALLAEEAQPAGDVTANGLGQRSAVRLRAIRAAVPPRLSKAVLERALATLARHPAPGLRRHLALCRLTGTLARMDGGSAEVEERHLDEAARLLGIEPLPSRRREADTPVEGAELSGRNEAPSIEPTPAAEEPSPSEGQPSPAEAGPHTATTESVRAEMPSARVQPAVVASLSAYPEDSAPTERDYASLQLPLARGAAQAQSQGVPIGVRKATGPEDLALVATLLAAAPFQQIRRRHLKRDPRDPRLILSVDDLRAWRRAPVADEILALLLDVTSYGDSDWPAALLPYVRAAYVKRAALCLVLVGAEGDDELRVQRLRARSVLSPELRAAFECRPGRATPLAHGLERILDTLRQVLRQGRSTVRRVQLVVVSDGRGNIPLEASREGHLLGAVGREGLDDAFAVARRIAELDAVESVLLDPQPRYGTHLPCDLAQALGARLEAIPRRGSEEDVS